jgi:hypothetical protein
MLSTMIFPPAFDTIRLYPEHTAEIGEQKPDEEEDDESSTFHTPNKANQ